jgi:hypothetical protein
MIRRRIHIAQSEGSLEERLRQALAERDQALLELARARADLDALHLAIKRSGEPEPRPYPISAGLEGPALRYVLADALNDTVKPLLGPVHRALRAAVERRWKDGSKDEP